MMTSRIPCLAFRVRRRGTTLVAGALIALAHGCDAGVLDRADDGHGAVAQAPGAVPESAELGGVPDDHAEAEPSAEPEALPGTTTQPAPDAKPVSSADGGARPAADAGAVTGSAADASPTEEAPVAPAAGSLPRLGIWGGAVPTHPGESAVANFDRWQQEIGKPVVLFRSRAGEGELDGSFLRPETQLKAAQGHVVSLQVQPKVGSGPSRHGICYEDSYKCIAAGQYDALIRSKLAELKALPPGSKHPIEIHSECNIQHGRVAAQPTVGTADEYPAFFQKIHDLALAEGVRDRLLFTVTMTRGPWASNEWKTWLKGIESLVDVIAVDGYSQPQTGNKKPLSFIVAPLVAVSSALGGRPIAVMETGCQEDPQDPAYKASWFDQSLAFVKANKALLYGVVFNTSDDGPGGWYPESSAPAKSAFLSLARDGVWDR